MRKGSGTTAPLWRTVAPERRDSMFRSIEFLAKYGFHAQTIADKVGCSKSQVYVACQKLQLKLRDYRDGKTKTAKTILRVAPPVIRIVRRKA